VTALELSSTRRRSGIHTAMSVAERVGLSVLYALILVCVPLGATGLSTPV